jgi:hypothetical protein
VIEVETKFTKSVETLEDAWAFVFSRVDSLGPDVDIRIQPTWVAPMGENLAVEGDWTREYVVTVKGIKEEEDG